MENKPKKLITRILEYIGLLALSAFLIRFAMCCILDIWPILLVMVVVTTGVVIGWRIWKNRARR